MTKYITLFLLLITTSTFSQWNSSTTQNTPICTSVDKQLDPRILEDGKGGAFIVWKDYRTTAPDIYIQRIDRNGYVKWTANGIGACTNVADQTTPNITTDGNGGCIITWADMRSGLDYDIYAQRLDSNGTRLWATNGVIVANKTTREYNEKIVSDGSGGAIIVWEQQTATGYDEWAQKINSSGTRVWATTGIAVSTSVSNKINGRLESDNHGGAYIVWQDFINGIDYDIYAQRMSSGGNLLWGSTGKSICSINGTQASPKIEPDFVDGGFYTTWVDGRGADNNLYSQRVDSLGNILWTSNGVSVCGASGNQSALDMLSASSIDGIIIAWKDNRSGSSYDIYSQRMNTSGVAQWTANGVAICTSTFDQLNPNLAEDETGGAIIAWQDSTTGNFNIRSQKISSTGTIQWTANGVNIATAADDQTSVKNCMDKNGGSIYVFMDQRTGTNDIYAHHLFANGSAVSVAEFNEKNAFSVIPNPFQQQTRITFTHPLDENSLISIHDITGKDVTGRVNYSFVSGNLEIKVNTEQGLNEGIYFVQIQSPSCTGTIKLIYSK